MSTPHQERSGEAASVTPSAREAHQRAHDLAEAIRQEVSPQVWALVHAYGEACHDSEAAHIAARAPGAAVLDAAFPPLPAVADSTEPLARAGLEALAELRTAMAERGRLEREYMQYLSPKATELYRAVCDAGSDMHGAEVRLHVAELARHLPGFAPAILLLWAHVIDCRLVNVDACCTDGQPVEP